MTAFLRRLRPARMALAVGCFLVVLAGAAVSGQRWVLASTALASHPTKVIVFGMAPMGFDDLGTGATPRLDAVVRDGAVAAMSTRTGSRRSTTDEGYLSLGAGARLRAPRGVSVALQPTEPTFDGLGDGASWYLEQVGQVLQGAVGVPGAPAAVRRNSGRDVPSKPGALGQALVDAGKRVGVVSNADGFAPRTGRWQADRPAALAAMDQSLSVADGVVRGDDLLVRDDRAPMGVRADADAVVAAVGRLSARDDVVVVDPGDLDRAAAYATVATDAEGAAAHRAALARTDAILGRVLDQADAGTLVMVVSVAAPGPGFHLAPVAFVGAGAPRGYLVSPSTKRTGVIAVTDLAPTILDAVGVPEPESMPGNAVRYQAGPSASIDHLRDLDRDTAFREWSYYGWSVGFISLHLLVYGAGALVLWKRPRVRGLAPAVRLGALGLAAFPLATFLFRAVPDSASLDHGAILAVVGIDAAVVLVAACFRRTSLTAFQVVVAATLAVIMWDVATGSTLHVNSWLGYSLHGGGRFYGIPNTTYALLAAGGLLLAASFAHHAERREEAVVVGALVLALVAFVDGAPGLGGDVGGIVSLVPVFAVVLLALAGSRIRPRTLVLIGVATVALLGGATTLDLLRPPEARTHLGRFAARVAHDGPSTVYDTFLRKQEANFRILRGSPWARMLPITAAFLAAVFADARRRAALVPKGSAVRVGVLGTLGGAVIGFASNDSGPIVLALFFAVLLPFVLLLALDEARAPS